MKPERDEPRLDASDARFAEKLRKLYAPESRTAEQRVAFARELEERLEHAGRRGGLLPLLAGAGIAAAAAWLLLSPAPVSVPQQPGRSLVADTAARQELEWQLFYPDRVLEGSLEAASDSRDTGLPDEYVAIAGAFLDD
jgi:hypothetical protein